MGARVLPMRDAVETGLLLMMFTFDGKRASRWMKNLAEYKVSDVIKALRDEFGIDNPLQPLYQMLSQFGHPNLIASIHVVEEIDVSDDQFLRTYHFGGYNSEGFMRMQFHTLLTLMMGVMLTALPAPYTAYDPEFSVWWEKMQRWPERLRTGLGLDIVMEPVEDADGLGEAQLRKLRVKLGLTLFNADNANKTN